MSEKSFSNKVTEVGLWIGTTAIAFSILLALVCPIFLPNIRKNVIAKYKGFDHQMSLAKEEMQGYTICLWMLCIISWIVVITFASFSSLSR